jgi:hypothetical protein
VAVEQMQEIAEESKVSALMSRNGISRTWRDARAVLAFSGK